MMELIDGKTNINKSQALKRIVTIENARRIFHEEMKRTPFPSSYKEIEKVFNKLMDEEIKALTCAEQ